MLSLPCRLTSLSVPTGYSPPCCLDALDWKLLGEGPRCHHSARSAASESFLQGLLSLLASFLSPSPSPSLHGCRGGETKAQRTGRKTQQGVEETHGEEGEVQEERENRLEAPSEEMTSLDKAGRHPAVSGHAHSAPASSGTGQTPVQHSLANNHSPGAHSGIEIINHAACRTC